MRYLPVLGLIVLVAATVGAATSSIATAGSAAVTNSNDAGAGSFRAAIELANDNASIGHIVFVANLAPIELQSTVLYDGPQSLDLVGNGAVLEGEDLTGTADAFVAATPGDLSVIGLTIRNAPGEGLEYQVPPGATGTKRVSLNGVHVSGAPDPENGRGGHGVLLNDQAFPEESGDPDASPPVPPTADGSAASLDVSVLNSEFDGNGFDELDRDGLRVNEGGTGDLSVVVRNTLVTDNGADGIELDERGDGDVVFTLSGVQITGNGSFHDVFPAADPEDIDLDDGMDVDESSDGDLIGTVSNSLANDNFEEGWDFNENDAGDFLVDLTNVHASRNLEEGVDFEEDDDFAGGGNLVTTVIGVTADENEGGDAGLKIREKGLGDLSANVRGAQANGNDGDGINVREDATGDLAASIDRATANENDGDGIEFEENSAGNQSASVDRSNSDANGQDGVEFDENSDGNLTAAVSRGSSSSNAVSGVRADQQSPGAGTLDLTSMALAGYPPGVSVIAVGVTVTQTP
jgi:hypothetical protein